MKSQAADAQQAASKHDQDPARRGPLRPTRLASARARLDGRSLVLGARLTDLAAIFLAAEPSRLTSQNSVDAILLLSAFLGCAAVLDVAQAYRFSPRETLSRHLARVMAVLVAVSVGVLAIAQGVVRSPEPIFEQILAACMRATLACALSHFLWFELVKRVRSKGLVTPNLLVVGATPAAERLIRAALDGREAHILGVFDDRRGRAPAAIAGVPVLGSTADLATHRILPYVDRIVLAVPEQANGRIVELLAELAEVPNPISVLLDHAMPEAAAGGRTRRLLDLQLRDLTGLRASRLKLVAKRLIDLLASALALSVAWPLFCAIALAIKLDSPGPVFFRQRRHGFLNEAVVVWKFRSMRNEAQDPTAARQVSADDDRITRVGRFLRRTSLDELPQLWNVLKGEMSLVGPRPHAIGMLTNGAEASRLVEAYAHRHRLKPGLTGWAAVNGSRGPVDTPEAVRQRVAFDLEYIERQSFWLDLAILLRTLPCLLGDGAVVR